MYTEVLVVLSDGPDVHSQQTFTGISQYHVLYAVLYVLILTESSSQPFERENVIIILTLQMGTLKI